MLRFIFFAFALLISSCANRAGISGGPEDKTAPKLLRQSLEKNSLQVALKTTVEFEFDEWLDPTTVKRGVFVSPAEPVMIIESSGRFIRITPKTPLRNDATYSISLGSSIKDLRGNALSEPLSLIFSTGLKLDSGRVEGVISTVDGTPSPSGFSVFVYPIVKDSIISPQKDKPLFISQSGDNGAFFVDGLPSGPFRLFGVRDANNNQRLNLGKELLAMPSVDVEVGADQKKVSGVRLLETAVDTSKPRLSKVKAASSSRLLIQFSKPVPEKWVRFHAASLDSGIVYSVEQSLKLDSVQWMLVLKPLQKGKYRLVWDAVLNDTLYDSLASRYDFSFSGLVDSMGPRLTVVRPAKGGSLLPSDSLSFEWDRPMDTASVRKSFKAEYWSVSRSKSDSTKLDTVRKPIAGVVRFKNRLTGSFIPEKPWQEKERVLWAFLRDSLRSSEGEQSRDSLLGGLFTVLDPGSLGSVSGTLKTEEMRSYRIAAISRTTRKRVETAPEINGKFAFKGLSEGAYRILVYKDVNRNSQYDGGTLTPFIFPEPFTVAQDSLFVRKRWELEGLNLTP